MKKLIVLMIVLTLFSSFMVGCTKSPAQDTDKNPVKKTTDTLEERTWPRTIVDGGGNKIVLEKQPNRITLLHIVYMEHLLALDTQPTAAAIGNAFGETEGLDKSELFAPYLKDVDMALVGNSQDLNLEAVLESDPDLLLTFHNPAGLQAYDQLVEIAPVVQLDYNSTWQEQLLIIGKILGKEQLAEKRIIETEEKIADAKEKLGQHKDKTLALFRTDGKNFIAQGNSKYYDTFGITKPKGFPDTAKPGDTTSLEGVSEMNPDYIVFQHNYDMSKAFVDSLESSPVWQSIDAVKNGRIYYFDENMNSYGPLTLNLAAEKLTEMYSK
ncbi:ABC transporter substrate-binding protein [Clostridium sp. UBA4395]|uniref:ABC transporter substrate-binding protein n=1 Tax=Clostridium sp. UBA4395 TaxID=1946360 RepID=UPI0032162553